MGVTTFGVVMNLVITLTLVLWSLTSTLVIWNRIRKAPQVKADRSHRLHVLTCPSE